MVFCLACSADFQRIEISILDTLIKLTVEFNTTLFSQCVWLSTFDAPYFRHYLILFAEFTNPPDFLLERSDNFNIFITWKAILNRKVKGYTIYWCERTNGCQVRSLLRMESKKNITSLCFLVISLDHHLQH